MILRISKTLSITHKKTTPIFVLICLHPQLIFFSVILLREAIIIFLITLSIMLFIEWYATRSSTKIIGCLGVTALAMIFHSGIITILIVYIFVFMFYDPVEMKIVVSPRNFMKALLIAGIISVILFVFRELLLRKFRFLLEGNFERLFFALNYTKGDSAYLYNMNYDSFADIFIYSIPRLFYFLFSPLPWDWRNFSDGIVFFFDSTIYFICFITIFKNYKHIERRTRVLALSLFISATLFSFLYAQATITAGTAIRHRSNILSIILVVILLIPQKIKRQQVE
jgi:hypothetical protein